MKFEITKENLTSGLIPGIIGTILFTYFLDPLLTFIGRTTAYMAQSIFKGYLDLIYFTVSKGDIDSAFYILLLLIVSCVVYAYREFIGVYNTLREIDQDIKIISNGITPQSTESPEKKATPSIQSLSTRLLRMKIKIWLVAILTTLIGLQLVGDFVIRKNISITHTNQMIILAPHISDQKHKELEAMYASMQNQQDYLKYRQELMNIASNNNIKLPKNILDK